MPKFEVTLRRTTVEETKLTVEAADEQEAAYAARALVEEGNTVIEWELDEDELDPLEVASLPDEEPSEPEPDRRDWPTWECGDCEMAVAAPDLDACPKCGSNAIFVKEA